MTQARRAPPIATVIVPVRNAADVVEEQLEALARQPNVGSLEVLVVDDASTDRTGELVRSWLRRAERPNFRLLTRPSRGGPNASRNDGIRAAAADFLLFCDGDDVVSDNWAEEMLRARSDRTILTGRYRMIGTAPDAPDRWRKEPWSLGWPYALGGSAALHRNMAIEVGGFDENILAGGTEVDFCIRAQEFAGATIREVEKAVVFHRKPSTGRGLFRREFHRARGRAYITRKLKHSVPSGQSARDLVSSLARLVRTLTRIHSYESRGKRLSVVFGWALGIIFWTTRFLFSIPPPKLLDEFAPVDGG